MLTYQYKINKNTVKNTIYNFYAIMAQRKTNINASLIYIDYINAIKKLPNKQKQVIFYRYIACNSIKDVAAKLNTSIGNVSKLSNLAINNIANNILEGEQKKWI